MGGVYIGVEILARFKLGCSSFNFVKEKFQKVYQPSMES